MRMLFYLFIILALLSSSCTDNSAESDENNADNGTVISTIMAPGNAISGLAWGDGLLWAVDASSNTIYSINTSTGDVVESFILSHSGTLRATGLAFSEEHNILLVGFWDYGTTGYVYQYTPDGFYKGSTSMCGG